MKFVTNYKFLAAVCALSLLSACDYEDVNTNQFEMTDEEGMRDGFAMGANVVAMQRTVFPVGTQADDTGIINEYQIAYHLSADVWSGFFCENNDWSYNKNPNYFQVDSWVASTYNAAYTKVLTPWKELKANAEKNDMPELFALAQVLKISAWHKALESFGPMPYTHAADNAMSIPFDSEETIYKEMFKDLTEAVEVLTDKAVNNVSVMPDFDIVYGGDATKWVKYANSLLLRLAMRVRYADEALSKQYVKQALTHSIGVMTSASDEAQVSTGAGITLRNNIYWLAAQYNEARMGSSMFSYLIGYNDPRVSAYFLPVADNCPYGVTAADGKDYQAPPAGHYYGQNSVFELFSQPNIKESTPTYWLRASEVYFLRAEAALVWGAEFGDAQTLYEAGVAMSFAENGITSSPAAYLNSDNQPAEHSLSGYYSFSNPAPSTVTPRFEGSAEQKLEKIITQKWIALYPNGQEAWTEWRRTGYPKLNKVMYNTGTSQGATTEGGVRRMLYPSSFYSTSENKKVYEDALKLFNNGAGGEDLASTRLWWDCKR